MKFTAQNYMIFLMVSYGLLEAHVVDFHISTPMEEKQIDDAQKRLEIEKQLEIFQDKDSDPEKRFEAFEYLVENGGIS